MFSHDPKTLVIIFIGIPESLNYTTVLTVAK